MDKHGFREIQKKLKLTNEGVSEALDVELFTVQNWASGNWPIPDPIVKFLRTLLSTQRDHEAIYTEGYNRGYRTGKEDKYLNKVRGYTTGYDEGYKEGCEVRYRNGFISAVRQ